MNKITRPILYLAIVSLVAVSFATPRPAEAAIHEIIAALCNGGVGQGGHGEVEPPGQVKGGQSFVRALLATGFIVSIEGSATELKITFDPTVPNSKFRDAGVGDVTIPNGAGPGVDLIFSPGIEPDPDFPAHANCPLFPDP